MCWLTGWLTVNAPGDGQATATRAMAMATDMATTWVMVTATRLAGNKEGKGDSGKGDGNGDEGGGQRRGQWQRQQEQWRQGWRMSDGDGD